MQIMQEEFQLQEHSTNQYDVLREPGMQRMRGNSDE